MRYVDKERITLHPDCGFSPSVQNPMDLDEAYLKLKAMCQGSTITPLAIHLMWLSVEALHTPRRGHPWVRSHIWTKTVLIHHNGHKEFGRCRNWVIERGGPSLQLCHNQPIPISRR